MSTLIIVLCALCAIVAVWFTQPASPKLAFVTSNRGSGRHTKYDVRLSVAAADARPRTVQSGIPIGGFIKPVAAASFDNAAKMITTLRLDLTWTGSDFDSMWTKLQEPIWRLSLADILCPPYIKLDIRAAKKLRPEYKERVMAMVHAMRTAGVPVDGVRYYLSGTTQSTKSGVLYAYAYKPTVTKDADGNETISGYWQQNGFSRDKDIVRGGALHAPAHYGIFREVDLTLIKVDDEDTSEFRIGNGQASAGWALFTLVTKAREMSTRVIRRQAPQIRAVLSEMGPRNILVKGELVYDPKLGPWELAVRSEDIKGDGAKLWASGSNLTMTIGCLEMGRHLSMGYSHQSLHFCSPNVYDAMVAERSNVVAELNSSMQPEKLARAAKPYIDKVTGQRRFKKLIRHDGVSDRQVLIAKLCQFALDVGNDSILNSVSINAFLMETFSEWVRRAALGNMSMAYLTAHKDKRVSINSIRINPADAPRNEDGSLAIDAKGVMVRGVRMPAQNAGVKVKVDLDHRCPRGHVWCHPKTFMSIGLDFDGDRLGILFPKTQVEQSVIEQDNPPTADDTGREGAEVFPTFDEAVYGQLGMNVGTPFYLIQCALTLAEAKPELADHIISTFIPDLNVQGQIGVDNAKHGGIHDTVYLQNVATSLKEMGLTPAMMAWYYIARGDLKMYVPLARSMSRSVKVDEFGGTVFTTKNAADVTKTVPVWDNGEACLADWQERGVIPLKIIRDGEEIEVTLNTCLVASDCCDASTPISESFQYFGENVIPIAEKAMANGNYLTRMPDGMGLYAQKAAQTLAWFNKMAANNSEIDSEDDREDARKGVSILIQDRYEKYAKWLPDDQRQFLMKLWNLSFSGKAHQTLLWQFDPDGVIDLMYEFAELWKVQDDGAGWVGRVYTTDDEVGTRLEAGPVKVTMYLDDETGGQIWSITRKVATTGKVETFEMYGAEANPEYTSSIVRDGALVNTTRKSATLQVWPNFTGSTTIGDKTKISPMLIAAGWKLSKEGEFYVFGNAFKADAKGATWWRRNATDASKWVSCPEALVRATVANKLDHEKLARWSERQAQRERDQRELEMSMGVFDVLDDGNEVAPDMSAYVADYGGFTVDPEAVMA